MQRVPLVFALTIVIAPIALAGGLNPPGAPASSMKTLDEVEPRIPVGPLTTPGDADSVYRITQPGSYYLTGNLAGQVGKHGVEIGANDVTLDLMGFTLTGETGSLSGVFSTRANLVVRNGVIRKWDGWGVDLSQGFSGVATDLIAADNGAGGVFLAQNSVIEGCIARANLGDGLVVSAAGLIADCTAESNSGIGIAAGSGSVIRDSRASSGLSIGIFVNGSIAEGCVAQSNTGDGIFALNSIVRDCNASFNSGSGVSATENSSILDTIANQNGASGVVVGRYSAVMRNLCTLNAAAGIQATGDRNRIEGNTVVRGGIGFDIDGAQNFLTQNTSVGATTNYDLAPGNICLVVTAAISGAFSGDAGGVSPGSTDPNANYAR